MSEHTKWRVLRTLRNYLGEFKHVWVVASGAQLVAECGEHEDAAKLIARAPDLLAENQRLQEALEEVLEKAEEELGDWACVEVPYLPAELLGLREIAEAAKEALEKYAENNREGDKK